MQRIALIVATIALFMVNATAAHSFQQGPIDIGHLSAGPAAIGGKVEVYGPILNTGAAPDQLAGATTDAASQIAVEDDSSGTSYVMQDVTLPPNQPLTLKPHGVHITLTGLKKAAAVGDSLPMTLHFAHAGNAQVTAVVQ